MLLNGATSMNTICPREKRQQQGQRQLVVVGIKDDVNRRKKPTVSVPGTSTVRLGTTVMVSTAAAAVMLLSVFNSSNAVEVEIKQQQQEETLSNIPQMLSGECVSAQGQQQDCRKARIQRPKSKKAESCTIKCVGTCIRGGVGSPGEGPLNIRRPLVVFKQGFRSRQYCLVECSDICNLIRDGDDGP